MRQTIAIRTDTSLGYWSSKSGHNGTKTAACGANTADVKSANGIPTILIITLTRKTLRMRVLIQRVLHASVTIEGRKTAETGKGMLILLGIADDDTPDDIEWLTRKIAGLRIFDDENGVMNMDIRQTGGDVLLVSQFTLLASTKKGNRPSYIRAAAPQTAIPLYERFHATLSEALGKDIPTGVFGADMKVELVNDGPVTIWIDSHNRE